MSKVTETVTALAAPVAAELGLELWDVEYVREGGEWFWSTDENGVPTDKPIVEEWKCPYHNGRMAFEVIERSRHAQL